MKPQTTVLLLIACGWLTLGTQASAGGSDPQIVLDEIYGQVAETCSGDGGGPAYDLEAIANAYFEAALASRVAGALADGSLGFDFLIDAQDCKVTALDLRVVGETATTATGRAEFENFGEPRAIDLVMRKNGETWKVADVVYRHRTFSLKTGE
jgi:hypothetical protein